MRFFAIAYFVLLMAGMPATQALSATVEVSIDENGFNPPGFTIQKGDTVRWTNNGTTDHSVTSGSNCVANGYFDSGLLKPEETFEVTFTLAAPDYAGVDYFDRANPSKTGGVLVNFGVSISPGNSVIADSESLTLMFFLSPLMWDVRLSIYFDGVLIYQEDEYGDLRTLPGATGLDVDPGISARIITLPPYTLPPGLHTLSVIARMPSGEIKSADTAVYTVLRKSETLPFPF